MLEAFEIVKDTTQTDDEVVVSYEERKKSRYKLTTVAGLELGWFLERGHVLSDGECLRCSDGTTIRVTAAEETVSEVRSTDTLLLTRAAYHLGNRHVPLQVGEGFLRYQHDHVLDDMVVGLGLGVECCQQPFHPENGAYHGSGGHSHGGHGHGDSGHADSASGHHHHHH